MTHEMFIKVAWETKDALRAKLCRMLRNEADADELLGDTYLRLLSLPPAAAADIQSPSAYAHVVARNLALDHVRRRTIDPLELTADPAALKPIDERASLEDGYSAQQDFENIMALIEGFPRRQREVFWLVRVEGYTLKETAALLEISEETVRKHLALAVVRLKQALSAKGDSK